MKHSTHQIIAWNLSAALALCVMLSGCAVQGSTSSSAGTQEQTQPEPVTRQSFYFDTVCSVTIYGMDETRYLDAMTGDTEDAAGGTDFESAASAVITEIFSLCSEYEQLLSKTLEGADIWNVNHAGGEAVTCDARTIEIVQKGLEYCELSGGRFDITVGLAADLWDFESGEEEAHLPDETALEEAVSHVDYTAVEVDADAGTIRLTDPEAELDLGGIAKGYIADAVCLRLEELGVTSAIVSLGGNIACVGGKPEEYGFQDSDAEAAGEGAQEPGNETETPGAEDATGTEDTKDTEDTEDTENTGLSSVEDTDDTEDAGTAYFTIGIETPYSDKTEIVGYSRLADGTMVTSGVYERYITVDGQEYHHILDVETGYPVETDVLGVTILGGSGTSADADALSTICLILGSEEGLALIEGMDGFEAAFIMNDGSVVTTGGMDFTAAS